MCSCMAHQSLQLSSEIISRNSIKKLIRAPRRLNAVQGNDFTIGLLKLLFQFMQLDRFKPVETGRIEEVNYTLLKNGQKYNLHGIPDVAVYEELVGADRILVATGEIQSTNLAHVQNLIYGVGKLLDLKDHDRPILCITILKSKQASLSMARYSKETPHPVTVKFVQSPFQVCLTTSSGVKSFATRIYHCLT